jgi:hypothetical protein
MKRLFAIASVTALVVAGSLVPAAAQSRYQNRAYQDNYADPYQPNGWNGRWNSRAVSDPSFGNRAGINTARRTGRCVADLGYGRFEYCGW